MSQDRLPIFKRLDLALFRQIDNFRATPNHAKLAEQYAGLEEHEQNILKAAALTVLFIIPLMGLGIFWWINSSKRADLVLRTQAVDRMQEIIAYNGAALDLTARVAAPQAIPDEPSLTSRLSNTLAASGLDLAKVRVSNFSSNSVSPQLSRSEADFAFNGLSTEQLVGLFTSLISSERFRIESVSIKRNTTSNLLEGQFHGVHFGQIVTEPAEN